jgi:hypothetical protein
MRRKQETTQHRPLGLFGLRDLLSAHALKRRLVLPLTTANLGFVSVRFGSEKFDRPRKPNCIHRVRVKTRLSRIYQRQVRFHQFIGDPVSFVKFSFVHSVARVCRMRGPRCGLFFAA